MPPDATPNPNAEDAFAITKPQAVLAAVLLLALLGSLVFALTAVPSDWYTPETQPASPLSPRSAGSDALQSNPISPAGLPPALGDATLQRTDREPLGLIPFPTATNPDRVIVQRQGTSFHTSTWLIPADDASAALDHYTRQLAALGLTTRGLQLPASQDTPNLPGPTLFLRERVNQAGRFYIRFLPADPPNASLRLIYDQASPASPPR
ncbi:MAG: hypothetical protein AAF797_12855 [Planctomycetota bacterium]